jgi:hypothetical protein
MVPTTLATATSLLLVAYRLVRSPSVDKLVGHRLDSQRGEKR